MLIRLALRAARCAAAPVIASLAIAYILVACVDRLPTTDAGADPSISDCCNWFILPLLYDRPGECLCKHTDPGMQRWLTCLGGLEEYTCDRRGQ
jgi:hypothetical protein